MSSFVSKPELFVVRSALWWVILLLLSSLCLYACLFGKRANSKPKPGIVCFFFLFYRDVEGVEPTAQSERVYRPENNCWRQRVWSPPKCSSFLQLVFQGPGEKVCLRSPLPPAVDPICSFHRAHLCRFFFYFLFSLPLSLLQVCEDFGS